jgi:hypothetical protein
MSTALLVALILVAAAACPLHMWWQQRRGRRAVCCPPSRRSAESGDLEALGAGQAELSRKLTLAQKHAAAGRDALPPR